VAGSQQRDLFINHGTQREDTVEIPVDDAVLLRQQLKRMAVAVLKLRNAEENIEAIELETEGFQEKYGVGTPTASEYIAMSLDALLEVRDLFRTDKLDDVIHTIRTCVEECHDGDASRGYRTATRSGDGDGDFDTRSESP
jgi:hypothetical protein